MAQLFNYRSWLLLVCAWGKKLRDHPDIRVTAILPGSRAARLSSSEASAPGNRYTLGPALCLLRMEICP